MQSENTGKDIIKVLWRPPVRLEDSWQVQSLQSAPIACVTHFYPHFMDTRVRYYLPNSNAQALVERCPAGGLQKTSSCSHSLTREISDLLSEVISLIASKISRV